MGRGGARWPRRIATIRAGTCTRVLSTEEACGKCAAAVRGALASPAPGRKRASVAVNTELRALFVPEMNTLRRLRTETSHLASASLARGASARV